MSGIVSLLDTFHYQQVENLWAELRREFVVKGVYVTPYPHFSYHVANAYNIEMLTPILHQFASKQTPFQVCSSGLGIFTGEKPVLYIPVVRTPQIAQFHETLWQALSTTGDGVQEYYHPTNWIPHITIGFGDINSENLGHVMRYLSKRDFNWRITVNNLALIHTNGIDQKIASRFEFAKQ